MFNESGVARGAGWQKIGAVTNLLAYYAIGIPVALLLGFVLKLNAKGLWIGILTGSTTQTLVLALLTAFTKWEKQVVTFLCFTYCFILQLPKKSVKNNQELT